MQVQISPADPFGEDAARLISRLSAELAATYPEDGSAGAGAFDPAEATGPEGRFLIAWLDGNPVGCVALRRVGPDVAEFKRLYVEPVARSLGISRQILAALEEQAKEMGFSRVLAETGLRQPRSLGLLKSASYVRIPNYGIYAGNPLSACFEKVL
jgi:GNAT superfamily N-acetyltransferase